MPEIKYFDISQLEEILSLARTVWPRKSAPEYPAFWKWFFCENPESRVRGPRTVISVHEGKLIGLFAGMRTQISIGGTLRDCHWMADWGIHPKFRLRGGAFEMVKRLKEDNEILLGVGNATSTTIGERLGFTVIRFPVANCLLDISRIVGRATRIPLLGIGANRLWQVVSARWTCGGEPRDLQLEFVESFDERFEHLCRRFLNSHPIALVRNRPSLKWRYLEVPGYSYKMLGAVSQGKLVGCAILRFSEKAGARVGIITDLLTDGGDTKTKRFLLKKCLHHCAREKAEKVKCLATPINGLADTLRSAGFLFGRTSVSLSVWTRSDDVKRQLLDKSKWYLSLGDSDMDFFST